MGNLNAIWRGVLALLVFLPAYAAAQTDKYFVDVAISNASPLLTEEVTLSYKLRYKGNSISLVNPRFDIQSPEFSPGFAVQRQGRSGGMDLDFSGNITVFEYAYILKPQKAGTFTIGAAQIKFEGASYASKSLTVKVLPADAPPDMAQADNIFIDANLTKSSPFKGEEFVLTYKLYSRYELLGIEEQTAPTIDGFSSNLLSRDQQPRIRVEKINGQDYYTLDLYRTELYPLRSGEFSIDPFQMTVVASVPTGRRIRDFWGNRMEVRRESLKLKSPSVRVNVRDLPSTGIPDDFNGAVGQFDLKTSLSATETTTGEPLTLRITLSGQGNLKLIGDPKLELPPGFEVYDPKISNGAGSKTYEYLLIPGKPGEFVLKPFSFSYFDPKTARYVSKSGESYTIKVAQGDGTTSSAGALAGLSKEEVEKLGQDIRYLETATPAFLKPRKPFLGSAYFFAGLAAPLLFGIPLFVMARKHRANRADIRGQRNRRARKAAEKRLQQARQLVTKGDRRAFYDELVRAIWGYLGDKFGMAQSELNRDQIRLRLAEHGLDAGTIDRLIALLDRAEMALFAPGAVGSLHSDCEDAISLLAGMDAGITKEML